MEKIEQVNRESAKVLRAEIESALSPVLTAAGMEISKTSVVFTPSDSTIKVSLTFHIVGMESPESRAFRELANLYGLAPEYLGCEFWSRGKVYKIEGLLPNSRKFPVLASDVSTGKLFKFAVSAVKGNLRKGTD